eukprot:CAMPEP_0202896486 /NCGR_PEP_ID=MMETSP1392-20130828/5486_1 /ASSEMBLY_ACC=CAM_ASM_000868 /TAXON_ID=225041 /ORGANISM="Chlamydomonas chlamydogama, Strain SAG 11-48b" /LENGTH=50 /DNA_ID=CAMNT_0049581863 /DNA_START=401 /DNA_END=553 /DNA_ORIENTATION=+
MRAGVGGPALSGIAPHGACLSLMCLLMVLYTVQAEGMHASSFNTLCMGLF